MKTKMNIGEILEIGVKNNPARRSMMKRIIIGIVLWLLSAGVVFFKTNPSTGATDGVIFFSLFVVAAGLFFFGTGLVDIYYNDRRLG